MHDEPRGIFGDGSSYAFWDGPATIGGVGHGLRYDKPRQCIDGRKGVYDVVLEKLVSGRRLLQQEGDGGSESQGEEGVETYPML